jgi:hypothetical protein
MRCELAPPRFFRPPTPVEVKKAGRFAFVQMLPLAYDQGESWHCGGENTKPASLLVN